MIKISGGSPPFGRCTPHCMFSAGFEPATFSMSTKRSKPTELREQTKKCSQMDLNHRPSVYQTDALNQLSYESMRNKIGCADTHSSIFACQNVYTLSYSEPPSRSFTVLRSYADSTSPKGFEPSISSVTGRRVKPLRYEPKYRCFLSLVR